jgi:hypothetical protein
MIQILYAGLPTASASFFFFGLFFGRKLGGDMFLKIWGSLWITQFITQKNAVFIATTIIPSNQSNLFQFVSIQYNSSLYQGQFKLH